MELILYRTSFDIPAEDAANIDPIAANVSWEGAGIAADEGGNADSGGLVGIFVGIGVGLEVGLFVCWRRVTGGGGLGCSVRI